MDFTRLTEPELSEFIRYFGQNPKLGFDSMVQQAQEIFNKASQDPNSSYPLHVVDLFLATNYLDSGEEITEKYTEAWLLNIGPDLKQIFAEKLGLETDDPNFNSRLIRILRMLDAIEGITLPPISEEYIESCPLLEIENQAVPLNWKMSDLIEPIDPDSEYGKLSCLGDGNCFFHAFLRAVDDNYIQSFEIPESISEEQIRAYENLAGINLVFPKNTFNIPRKRNNPDQIYDIRDDLKFSKNMNKFRRKYSCEFRKNLANYIQTNNDAQDLLLRLFPGIYDIALDEALLNFNASKPNLTEEQLDKVKDSALKNFVDYYSGRIGKAYLHIEPDILILLSELYNFDIYILSQRKITDPGSEHPFPDPSLVSVIRGPQFLRIDEDPYLEAEERPSIIMIHSGGVEGHYDLVVRSDQKDNGLEIKTKFDSEEPLIQVLYNYVIISRF